jgi:hypothetical protein
VVGRESLAFRNTGGSPVIREVLAGGGTRAVDRSLGYLTTAWKDTSPDAPGGITPGRSHFSSVEPTRFSPEEKVDPWGPMAVPLTYSRRGKRLSTIDADRIGVLPMLR